MGPRGLGSKFLYIDDATVKSMNRMAQQKSPVHTGGETDNASSSGSATLPAGGALAKPPVHADRLCSRAAAAAAETLPPTSAMAAAPAGAAAPPQAPLLPRDPRLLAVAARAADALALTRPPPAVVVAAVTMQDLPVQE